jgi:radical SAM protein with 4Fe4S-binding SPASM domain
MQVRATVARVRDEVGRDRAASDLSGAVRAQTILDKAGFSTQDEQGRVGGETVESIGYQAFSAHLHGRAAAVRGPTNATFEITRRCPLSCQHCYNNLPMGDRQARAAELSLAEHQRILDELTELGCLWLLYTGGEIFARRDFLKIYAHAKKKGFLITLFTNGTLISPSIADLLRDSPPFSIEITLYGHSRETYERLTGVPGSHEKCLKGIQLLLERGLPLKLKTVAVSINKHELDDMKAYAQKLGVPFKFDAMMSPRLDCSQSPLEVRLQPDECVELDLRDEQRMAEWRTFADRFVAPPPEVPQGDSLYHCGGGVSAFAVDPYGGMSICVLSEREKFDLKTGSVREGWEQFLAKVRARRARRTTKCTSCALKSMCGMCPANGELENGDPEAPVDFLCRVAHLRAFTFGFPVKPHGPCEYCPGGEGHQGLQDMAAELRRIPVDRPLRSRNRPQSLIVMRETEAASGCASGGCSSCSGEIQ